MSDLKIGILVVAYNASSTIERTLDRIPQSIHSSISEILVSDDFSKDRTTQIAQNYAKKSQLPLTVVRQPKNLGYGGNQKFGYWWAIEKNLDIVILLHADGQYAPEYLEEIFSPIVNGTADAVFGSRMMIKGAAKIGGMPLYKRVGNFVLTRLQNKISGTNFSEWHSGYRAYRVSNLQKISLQNLSNGFRFDTQIILELLKSKSRIIEVPIPTFYGDEVSHVNGIVYGIEIIIDTLKYRFLKK